MNAIQILKALGPIDVQNIRRDDLLKWIVGIPPVFALSMRFVMPLIFNQLEPLLQMDLDPYFYPFLGVIMTMLTPALAGVVIGFLLLDERDDQTLSALQVTPMPLNGYLAYRLIVPVIISIMLTILVFPLVGIHQIGFWGLLAVALSSAPYAPILALFLAGFAQNKVQGFAIQKASGVVGIPPLIAYFVTMPWQLAFGLVPNFWPAKIFWMLLENQPGVWIVLIVGLIYQSFLIWLLLKQFNRKAYQT